MLQIYLFLALVLISVLYQVIATNSAGLEFLEKKKSEEGVITLPSGLMYKVLRKGSGTHHPTINSACECHYAGSLIDGTEFDSSYARGSPTSFAPNQVIKGWTEAMQLMVEGDKWELYIPSELGYGDRGSPPKIPGGDALVFQMEIIQIKGDKVPALTCNPYSPETSGCNEEEVKYLTTALSWDSEKLAKENLRLNDLLQKSPKTVKPSQLQWMQRRSFILSKILSHKDKEL